MLLPMLRSVQCRVLEDCRVKSDRESTPMGAEMRTEEGKEAAARERVWASAPNSIDPNFLSKECMIVSLRSCAIWAPIMTRWSNGDEALN